MKSIQLSSRRNEDWGGQRITAKLVEHWVDEEAEVFKPDGSLLCRVRKNVLSKESLGKAWGVLRPLKLKSDNRGTATGLKMVNPKLKDGTVSKTNRVPDGHSINSGIIGFFDRNPRMPYCRACAWNQNHPDKWHKLLPLFKEISDCFAESVPDRYAAQKKMADQTNPDFMIPGTVFSTITVNKNWRTACHKDAGDLPEGFGVMVLIREGLFKGGELVFPDFGVGVKYDTGDVCFADVHEWHGNTPIVGVTKNYQRCTLICYYRKNMIGCGSAEEELERAKNRKLGDSLR